MENSNPFLSGPIKCPICNQGYSETYITEDGICDYCDQDRLDREEEQRKKADYEALQKEWEGLSGKQQWSRIRDALRLS